MRKLLNSRIFVLITFIFSCIYFLFKVTSNITLIGTIEDEIYFGTRKRVVGIYPERGTFIVVFNEYENRPNNSVVKEYGPIKLVSQSIPPMGVLYFGEKKFLLFSWFHAGFPPYMVQNLFLYFRYDVIFARFLVLIFSLIIFLAVGIILLRVLKVDYYSALLGMSSFLISSAFTIASVQSASFPYIFAILCMVLSFFFFKNMNFVPSFIFLGLAALSYIKFGINLFLVYLIFLPIILRDLKKILKNALLMLLIFSLFISPYFIFSFAFYELDRYLPRPNDFSFFSFFPRTPWKVLFHFAGGIKGDFFEAFHIVYQDIKKVIDIREYGVHLHFYYEHKPGPLSLVPLISFIFSFLNRGMRPIFFFTLLYVLVEALSFPLHGFHRRLLPVVPFISVLIGGLSGYLLSGGVMKKVLSFVIFLVYIYIQAVSLHKVESTLRSGKVIGSYSPFFVQKQLADFLIENGIYELSNFSALINLEVLTGGKVVPQDWSYVWLWTDFTGRKLKFLSRSIIQLNEGRYVLLSWLKPYEYFEKITKEYGYRLMKVRSFPSDANPVFEVVKIEKEN